MTKEKYKILYIDDEESNLRIFKNTFRREFEVFLASSAKMGIEILHKHSIDVLITDQRMPQMTGVELLRVIKEQFPNIPPNRLMVSGYAAPGDIDDAFNNYDLFRFIAKPWDAEELKHIILTAINMRHD